MGTTSYNSSPILLPHKYTRLLTFATGSTEEIGNSQVKTFHSPQRYRKVLPNFHFILPKFHFILPKFYFILPKFYFAPR